MPLSPHIHRRRVHGDECQREAKTHEIRPVLLHEAVLQEEGNGEVILKFNCSESNLIILYCWESKTG